jgi:hypothetical protein
MHEVLAQARYRRADDRREQAMIDMEYELESPEYWAHVDEILKWPFALAPTHSRPMFEVLPA